MKSLYNSFCLYVFLVKLGENWFQAYIKVPYPFYARNGSSLLLILHGEHYIALTWTSDSRRLWAIWLLSERLRYFLLWNSFSSSSSCSLVKAVLRLLVLPGPRPLIPREQPPASMSRGPWPSSSSSPLHRDSLSSGISVKLRERLAKSLIQTSKRIPKLIFNWQFREWPYI